MGLLLLLLLLLASVIVGCGPAITVNLSRQMCGFQHDSGTSWILI